MQTELSRSPSFYLIRRLIHYDPIHDHLLTFGQYAPYDPTMNVIALGFHNQSIDALQFGVALEGVERTEIYQCGGVAHYQSCVFIQHNAVIC
jgi:hypothetical protein